MKKALILLLIVFLAFFGTACSNDKDSDSSKTKKNEPVKIQITSKPIAKAADDVEIKEETVKISKKNSTNATDPTSKAKPKKKKKKKSSKLPTQGQTQAGTYISVTSPPKGSLKPADLSFYYKGKNLSLDEDIENAFKLLGEDNSVTELSKTKTEYEYDDVTLVSYTVDTQTKSEKTKKSKASDEADDEVEKPEKIEQITVTSDKLSTQKGAKIGMYATKLKGLYGDPSKKTSTAYTYTIGNKSLVFNYENNLVTSFSYVLTR